MRKIAIAEWILSCTMPRERAAAAAGDLAEFPGQLAFWTSLVRLSASASFRSLARAPLKFMGGTLLMWVAFLLTSIVYRLFWWGIWAVLHFRGESHWPRAGV